MGALLLAGLFMVSLNLVAIIVLLVGLIRRPEETLAVLAVTLMLNLIGLHPILIGMPAAIIALIGFYIAKNRQATPADICAIGCRPPAI